jgi:AcrR family transcriptional regulator
MMDNHPPTRGAQTRADILQAAHRLFVEQGYHGTSMRQIAENAHIALGGIYNHFSGKEEIFEAVFITYHPSREVLPLVAQAEGDSLETWLRGAAKTVLEALKRRPDFLNLLFIETVEFNNTHAHKLFRTIFPQGMQIVERIRSTFPEIKPLPAEMVMRSFLGMFLGYYITEILLGPDVPTSFRKNAMDHFVDIYLHGIMADGASAEGTGSSI